MKGASTSRVPHARGTSLSSAPPGLDGLGGASPSFGLLPATTFVTLFEHVQREYPVEACGFVLRRGDAWCVLHAVNLQGWAHRWSPARYPRPATHAYRMAPWSLLALRCRTALGWFVSSVYHSHTQAMGARLSSDDVRWALHGSRRGDPRWPCQLVLSVRPRASDREPAWVWEGKRYRWDSVRRLFELDGYAWSKAAGDWGQAASLALIGRPSSGLTPSRTSR